MGAGRFRAGDLAAEETESGYARAGPIVKGDTLHRLLGAGQFHRRRFCF